MTAQIVPFRYDQSAEVRTVIIDGEPWFVAADIARVLGYSEAYAMTRTLDDDEKGPHTVRTPGGDQSLTVISESGLYSAILRSRIEGAKAFKRWITREVIPSIRKTGAYSTETPALPQTYAEALRALADAADAAELAQARIVELEPWESLAGAEGDYAVADAAKMLSRVDGISIGRDRLFARLSEWGWIYRATHDRHWCARQSQVDLGRLAERANRPYVNGRDEYVATPPTLRITPKGLAEIQRRLTRGLAVVAS